LLRTPHAAVHERDRERVVSRGHRALDGAGDVVGTRRARVVRAGAQQDGARAGPAGVPLGVDLAQRMNREGRQPLARLVSGDRIVLLVVGEVLEVKSRRSSSSIAATWTRRPS
jgi:hypothetical protein